MENIDIKEVSRKSTNSTSKHRVILFGHHYIITDKAYSIYEAIAETLCVVLIFGGLYAMYCMLWLMGL